MKFSQTILFSGLFTILSLTASESNAQHKKTDAKLQAVQKQYGLDPNTPLLSRIAVTPDDVIIKFREAGMSPTEHQLTKEETKVISKAIAALPPLHQRVLRQHLKSISFLDNMPNTALTSPVTKDEGVNLYHITFRAGILHQTISEWVTEKERTCYTAGDSSVSVSIQAGMLSAITYVMLHEGTHVVDGSLQLLAIDTIGGKPQPNKFTADFSRGIWKNIGIHDWHFKDSLMVKSRFRPGGRRFLTGEAVRVYEGLSQTPFMSLYGTASWHEDLAELLTVYHLNQMFKQPFRFVVVKNGKEVFSYEPMKSALLQRRLWLLKYFYSKA
ncbi:hypothetical protein GCM10023149_25200 [Mucilaginibacter gynuensis]|uniref:Secreted protein n=1 Tax=Mucilaginibacter gynuensis TaxID=1302236 RepID=A0ABP8GGD9_9SPHI